MSDKIQFIARYACAAEARSNAADLREFLVQAARARRYFNGYFAGIPEAAQAGIPREMRDEFWHDFQRRFPGVCAAIEVADEEFDHPSPGKGEDWPTPRTDPWPCLSGFSDDAADSLRVDGERVTFTTEVGVDRYPDEANPLNFDCFLGDVVTGRFNAHDLEWSVAPATEGPSPGG